MAVKDGRGVQGAGAIHGRHARCTPRRPDPPPIPLLHDCQWSKLLGECTGTGFHTTPAPLAPLRVVFVNRPWSQGRSLLNLPETLDWLRGEWAPSRSFGAPLAFEAVSVSAATELRDQIAVFQRASVLVYPHGATMAHAQFLPRNAAVLEVIPWKNVTEPHGWLLVRTLGCGWGEGAMRRGWGRRAGWVGGQGCEPRPA